MVLSGLAQIRLTYPIISIANMSMFAKRVFNACVGACMWRLGRGQRRAKTGPTVKERWAKGCEPGRAGEWTKGRENLLIFFDREAV